MPKMAKMTVTRMPTPKMAARRMTRIMMWYLPMYSTTGSRTTITNITLVVIMAMVLKIQARKYTHLEDTQTTVTARSQKFCKEGHRKLQGMEG